MRMGALGCLLVFLTAHITEARRFQSGHLVHGDAAERRDRRDCDHDVDYAKYLRPRSSSTSGSARVPLRRPMVVRWRRMSGAPRSSRVHFRSRGIPRRPAQGFPPDHLHCSLRRSRGGATGSTLPLVLPVLHASPHDADRLRRGCGRATGSRVRCDGSLGHVQTLPQRGGI
jgi:hypothetical protein